MTIAGTEIEQFARMLGQLGAALPRSCELISARFNPRERAHLLRETLQFCVTPSIFCIRSAAVRRKQSRPGCAAYLSFKGSKRKRVLERGQLRRIEIEALRVRAQRARDFR